MRNRLALLLYSCLTIGPLALGLGYSLLYSFGLVGLLNRGFTLEHWQNLWSGGEALGSFAYSALLTFVSLFLMLAIALGLSWHLKGQSAGRGIYPWLFIPLLFPPLVGAFAWFYVLSPGGILARLAFELQWIERVEQFPRLVNDRYSIGILITHVFLVFPLFTLLFIEQGRKERVSDLLQTAQTLGGNGRQFFRKVYCPLVLQRSAPLIWLYGIFLFGTYEVPLLLGRSSPRVVTLFIQDKLSRYNLEDIPVGHAMAVVYSVLVLLVVRLFIRKENLRLI